MGRSNDGFYSAVVDATSKTGFTLKTLRQVGASSSRLNRLLHLPLNRVPHLRDSFIVAKVGIVCGQQTTALLKLATIPQMVDHLDQDEPRLPTHNPA
jgi:hypothetical protein